MPAELGTYEIIKALGGTLLAAFGLHYKSIWGRVSALENDMNALRLNMASLPTKEDLTASESAITKALRQEMKILHLKLSLHPADRHHVMPDPDDHEDYHNGS